MLYALNRDQELGLQQLVRRYNESINHSFELYLYTLAFLVRIAECALEDAHRRAAKLLPSDEDKFFTPKLFDNELIRCIRNNENLKRLFKQFQFEQNIDPDISRNIYTEFAKSDEYKDYVRQVKTSTEEHIKMMLDLFKFCLSQEIFTDTLDDHYPNWEDDESLTIGAVKKTIKALPTHTDFFNEFIPDEEATREFGENLLVKVIQEDKLLLDEIEPTLKNWDADRVAVIDMILLKMALSELIHFPTIPTKVTLNEFVEISKLYSTEKSKDFINGILDRLMKKLSKEGKIVKEGRGLQE